MHMRDVDEYICVMLMNMYMRDVDEYIYAWC